MSEEKRKSLSGRILRWFGILVVVLVVLTAVAWFFIDGILKKSICTVGSMATKCEVQVDDISLSHLKGTLLLEGLRVGSPQGFKAENALSIDKVYVSLERGSVFKNPILVHEIQVEGFQATYEVAILSFSSNIGTILDNIGDFNKKEEDEQDEEEESDDEEDEGKKVVIEHILVKDSKVTLAANILGGSAGLPIPLPDIELNDIGKQDEEGATIMSAIEVILKGILAKITEVVK